MAVRGTSRTPVARSGLTAAVIACVLLAAAACRRPPAAEDLPAEQKALADATERYVVASVQGDATALARLYTDSAVLLPPGREPVEGREAIEAFWRGGLEEGLQVRTSRIEVSGNVAYTIGRWHLPATAEDPADSGKLVLCWKREGSQWKLTADIWNATSTGEPESDSPGEQEPDDRPDRRRNPVT
ncbi:MAG: DUF4440 domain-containing protein [Gemmatimonadales bacterium]|nr:DUF4440 domain-containing protein [Gemmatimonadales bacterium]